MGSYDEASSVWCDQSPIGDHCRALDIDHTILLCSGGLDNLDTVALPATLTEKHGEAEGHEDSKASVFHFGHRGNDVC